MQHVDLSDQSWKSILTSLLVSWKNPYPSLSEWLPSLSLKQGNISEEISYLLEVYEVVI
jgi:hypothetical protein